MNETKNVLIAEDEPNIASKVKLLFLEHNYNCDVVSNIPDLFNALSQNKHYHLLILDRLLGTTDSADSIKILKNQYPLLKVFVLSAIDSASEKAKLIDDGADDYLSKPFDSTELIARSKSLLRRELTHTGNIEYSIAKLKIDLLNRSVSKDASPIALTSKEFLVLHTLAQTKGKVFSKAQLIEIVWGYSLENDTNVVESTMNSLRRKLESAQSGLAIKNTRNVGYWLED